MKNNIIKELRIIFVFFCFITAQLNAQLPGFILTGDPESSAGATWSYSATVGSVFYNLKGLLYKPIGSGKFPSVIINHGTGGNTAVGGYSDLTAKEMVKWGYVCIATNACHSGTTIALPCGSPGTCDTSQWGARTNNFLRTLKVWDILASFSYVDTNCIATFGHSRGAFLTTGLAGSYPHKFSCAGHTAGGLAIPDTGSVPTSIMANNVSIPYIMHHGTLDTNVPISWDNNLNAVFNANGITHSYYTYTGFDHYATSNNPLIFSRTKDFFNLYNCTSVGINEKLLSTLIPIIFPNPASNNIQVNLDESVNLEIKDVTGKCMLAKNCFPSEKIDISYLANGVYFASIKLNSIVHFQKLVISK